MPHINQYQDAVRRGQRRNDDNKSNDGQKKTETDDEHGEPCEQFYSTCHFSVKTFNQKYSQLFNPETDVEKVE